MTNCSAASRLQNPVYTTIVCICLLIDAGFCMQQARERRHHAHCMQSVYMHMHTKLTQSPPPTTLQVPKCYMLTITTNICCTVQVLDGPQEELRRDALDTICALAVALVQDFAIFVPTICKVWVAFGYAHVALTVQNRSISSTHLSICTHTHVCPFSLSCAPHAHWRSFCVTRRSLYDTACTTSGLSGWLASSCLRDLPAAVIQTTGKTLAAGRQS